MCAKPPDLDEFASPPSQDLSYSDLEREATPIGQGGQAIVYKAGTIPEITLSTVALKEPLGGETMDSESVERFLSRADTWALVDQRERTKQRWADYEHVVGVIATGTELPWIAMEFMDGGDLESRLESHSDGIPIEEGIWIAECVCRALEVAHSYGIAHLDIKPANVLFRETPDGDWDLPKVADWGLARLLAEETGSIEGRSLKYAAPEQFQPDEYGTPDTVTDIYQVGALAYAALTGRPPYEGSQASVMYDVVHGEDPTPPSNHRTGLPDGLDQVILTALERDKHDRYDTVQEFKQALGAIRTGGRLPPIVAQRLDERQQAGGNNKSTTETTQDLSQSRPPESETDTAASTSTVHSTDDPSENSDSTDTVTRRSLDRSTLLQVLGQLTDDGATSVSGEELAAEFDAGRSEVYDILDELKSEGRVEYASGYGYKLVDDEDETGGETKAESTEENVAETSHGSLQQDTLLSELESLSDGGAKGVSGSDLADRFEAEQGDVYDLIDELRLSGDIEYVSGEGYKPLTSDRVSLEQSRSGEESESRGTQGTPDNSLDPERVRSTLAAITDEGSKGISGAQLASKFDASRGEVYDVLDDLKANSEVKYVSGQGYTLTQRGYNQRTTPMDDRRQLQGSLADQATVREGAAVEFLNYEVVQERGWDPSDPEVFEQATAAELSEENHAVVNVGADDYILEAAEAAGYDWPYSCRAGACTNCAAIVVEGQVDMDMQQVLTDEEVEQKDIRLTCIATPVTDTIKLIYNAKHLDYLQSRVI